MLMELADEFFVFLFWYFMLCADQGWKWVRWPEQSGSLGSLFGGPSGSHPQTELSGCDPDITWSLENNVGIW